MNLLLFVADHAFYKRMIAFTRLLSENFDLTVTLLYATRRKKNRARGEEAIEVARQSLHPLHVETLLRVGEPIKSLEDEIAGGKYDLLMLGTKKKPGILKRAADSVTPRFMNKSGIPVVVVTQAPNKVERILICTGGVQASEPVVTAGAQFAEDLNAEVTLLHVGPTLPTMYAGLQEMEETTEEVLDRDTPLARHLRRGAKILAEHHVEADVDVEHGIVADEILRECVAGNYDLIVLGATRERRDLMGWVLGDITAQVIDRSPTPVLIIHHD